MTTRRPPEMVLQTLRDLKPSNHFLYLCIVQFVYGFFFCNQYKLDPHSLSLLCHMTPSLTLFGLNLGVLLAGCRVALVCHKSRHVHLIFQTGHTAFTIRKAILWFFFWWSLFHQWAVSLKVLTRHLEYLSCTQFLMFLCIKQKKNQSGEQSALCLTSDG